MWQVVNRKLKPGKSGYSCGKEAVGLALARVLMKGRGTGHGHTHGHVERVLELEGNDWELEMRHSGVGEDAWLMT